LYDLLNRPVNISTPNDDVTGGVAYSSISYQGLATETTNPKNQVERVEKNLQGQVVRRINNKTINTTASGTIARQRAGGSAGTPSVNAGTGIYTVFFRIDQPIGSMPLDWRLSV
jgi:hypothetical protein